MTDPEFQSLKAQLWATARYSAPQDEEANGWVRSLDTAGGPDRWWKADLYYAMQAKNMRRRGIPEADQRGTDWL